MGRRGRAPWGDATRLAAIVAWSTLWVSLQAAPSGLSWHFFVDGARMLFSRTGLHLYAAHPELQIGPLAFVVAAPWLLLPADAGRVAAQLAMMAVGPALVAWLGGLVPEERRRTRVFLGMLVLVPAWSVLAVRFAHLDDVLALILAVAALRAVAAKRPLFAGLALAAAMGAKPWAVGFAPLLLVLERERVRALAVAIIGAVLAWIPFLVADPATLSVLQPPEAVAPSSGLAVIGLPAESTAPAWGRVAQLILEPLFAIWPVVRGRWPGIMLVAVAVRLTLDPKDNPYYVGGLALAALVFDLLATRWTVPWTTLLSAIVFWQPWAVQTSSGLSLWWFQHPEVVAAVHVAWSLALIALVVLAPSLTLPRKRGRDDISGGLLRGSRTSGRARRRGPASATPSIWARR